MAIKNVSPCAVTVQTSVHYVQDLTQEVLPTDKNFTLCVLKFAKHVQKSVLSMQLTMQVAKNVLMPAKNVQKFVQNLLQPQYNFN